jgi:subtilase family serine protease
MVYQAPTPTLPSFVDMYTAIDEDNQADVVGTSFGLCELFFLPSYNNGTDYTFELVLLHDLFLQGNAQGITFVASSGDNGAQGGECTDPSGTNAIFGVQAFADDPNVTGVGGTNLITSSIPGSLQSTYVSEDATFDSYLPGNGFANGAIWGSGGGKSVIWAKPIYQTLVNTGAATRSVPDLAMMEGGCPFGAAPPCGTQPTPNRSAFVTALGGALFLIVGTSGSSAEFAGLQAIQDQVVSSRAGNVNYLIYLLAQAGCVGTQPVFRNDIIGNNGYPSHRGYNFVVGNGTPYGFAYALAPNAPLAGDPQTPTNP